MKMDFPQVDLPTEVLAWTNVTEDILNIYKAILSVASMYCCHLYRRFDESLHQSA